MTKIIYIFICLLLICSSVKAENRYFLGTKNGLLRTNDVFMDGKYKNTNLFLIAGAKPTTKALKNIHWRPRTTYYEDLRYGTIFFKDQINETGKSIPKNFSSLGKNMNSLVSDPVKSLKNISLLTPITILFKTSVNTLKIAWNGIVIVGEPVFRIGSGTIILAGAPLFKPLCYTWTTGVFAVTSVYGYGSSAAGGTVLLGATGAVFALDVATSPFVFLYSLTGNNENREYLNINSGIKSNKYFLTQIH